MVFYYVLDIDVSMWFTTCLLVLACMTEMFVFLSGLIIIMDRGHCSVNGTSLM